MLNVKKVNYDENFTSGCETCDYGSHYINEIEIILEDGTYTNIKVDKMYDYVLSESDYMKIIANSNNINDFLINILNKIKENRYDKNLKLPIELENLLVIVNGETIDIIKTLEKEKIVKDDI